MIPFFSSYFVKTTAYLKSKFIRDVFWTLTSTLFQRGIAILIIVFVGRFYTVEALGIYSRAVALYLVLATVAGFGLNNSVVKFTAEYQGKREIACLLTSTAFVLAMLLGSCVLGLFYLTILLFPDILETTNLRAALLNITFAIPLFSANKVFMGFLNGMRYMRHFASVQAIRWLLILFFILLFYILGKPVTTTLYAFPAAELCLFLWLFSHLKRTGFIGFRINTMWLKKHLSFGGKTVVINAIGVINNRIDILLIGGLTDNTQTGIYSLSSAILKGMILIASTVSLNLNPLVSSLWSRGNRDKLQQHLAKMRKGSVMLMIPILGGAALAFPFFVKIVMNGGVYDGSISVFYILLPGITVMSLFRWCGGILPMAGYPEESVKIRALTLGFYLTAYSVLIPLFGINGAALATSSAYFFIILLQRMFIKRILGLQIF